MTTYAYARTSSLEQQAGLTDQITRLTASGCDKVFSEQVSATDMAARKEWSSLLSCLKHGDSVVITKIDRLARSISNMVEISETLKNKGVSLRILDMNIDTTTPTGTLMFNIFTSIAAFEKDMMLERQRVGIASAKEKDKLLPLSERTYKGRAATARAKLSSVKALLATGKTKQQVADDLGIGIASLYRMVKDDAATAA